MKTTETDNPTSDEALTLAMAEQFLDGGHPKEALALLQQLSPDDQNAYNALSLKIEALLDLDHVEEAVDNMWALFAITLYPDVVEELLDYCDDPDLVFQQAFNIVMTHTNPVAGLRFCAEGEHWDQAARLVLTRYQDIRQTEETPLYLAAAQNLASLSPLAATLLYRLALESLARQGATYNEELAYLDQLAGAIEDWQGYPSHEAYLAQLQKS